MNSKHLVAPIALALTISTAAPADAAVVAADWTSIAGGTIDGVDFSVGPFPSFFDEVVTIQDLVLPAFAHAPLAGVSMLTYGATDDFTITFAAPVDDLLLYVRLWRGSITTGPDPDTTYSFDQPFSVASGLSDAIIGAGEITLPDGFFHDGILRFAGPISALRIESSATSAGAQLFTLAVGAPGSVEPPGRIPLPATAPLFVGGVAGLAWLRRKRS